jgi:hypothetical protein
MVMRPPPPLDPSWRLPVALGDGAHAEAEERLDVVHHLAVARGDEDLADLFGEAGLGLDDLGAGRHRGLAGALEQGALVDAGHVERERGELVAAREDAALQPTVCVPPTPVAICAAVSAARCMASQLRSSV